MRKQDNQIPPALKHGAYSGTALLPGEDPTTFKKLHNDLIVEFSPFGALEDDIVATIARLMWRKQNLSTYRMASRAKDRFLEIKSEILPKDLPVDLPRLFDSRSPEEIEAAHQKYLAAYAVAEQQAQRELGPAWDLVKIGDVATTQYLLDELSVIDRLDGMIDRCVKRLLMVRGVKSLSFSPSTAPTSSRKRLDAA
jgi:hypothetical protein